MYVLYILQKGSCTQKVVCNFLLEQSWKKTVSSFTNEVLQAICQRYWYDKLINDRTFRWVYVDFWQTDNGWTLYLIRYESRVMLFQLSSSIHSSSVFFFGQRKPIFFTLQSVLHELVEDHRIFNRHRTVLSWENMRRFGNKARMCSNRYAQFDL